MREKRQKEIYFFDQECMTLRVRLLGQVELKQDGGGKVYEKVS